MFHELIYHGIVAIQCAFGDIQIHGCVSIFPAFLHSTGFLCVCVSVFMCAFSSHLSFSIGPSVN